MIELVEHRDAFECLFRENYTRLFYHAFSFLNDEEEAKDVVNDVFERVWMNFEKLEFSSSLVPLLYTLVRNRCVSLIRHKKVKERFSREIEVELEDHEEESVEYEMQIEKLRHLIELLPAQTKNVFKKCFLEGKKYQEAADDLGISINTVKTQVISIKRRGFCGRNLLKIIFCYLFFLDKKIKKVRFWHHPFRVCERVLDVNG